MAKVVNDKQEVVAVKWGDNYRAIAIAVAVGLVWWLVWLGLKEYVLNIPLTAGSVAGVIAAVVGTGALIRYQVARPLVVTMSATAVLWTLGGALAGLWWVESLAWAVGLFAVSYGLFSLIANIRNIRLSISVAIITALLLVIFIAL